MNVGKNWALTIISIALAFAHFSSELLVKKANYYPREKKTLNNAGHIDAKIESILAKFAKTKSSKISCFLLIVSWQSFPPKISREIGQFFSAKIPQNRPIFPQILTFSRKNPAKSADFSTNLPLKIPRNFDFFSANYQKP